MSVREFSLSSRSRGLGCLTDHSEVADGPLSMLARHIMWAPELWSEVEKALTRKIMIASILRNRPLYDNIEGQKVLYWFAGIMVG